MNRIAISGLLVVCLVGVAVTAQQKAGKPKADTKEAKIARALSAGPTNIAKAAKVVDRDENGKEIVLREGHDGVTCFPGHPWVVDDIAYCANDDALQWEADWHGHKPKPTNTQPGFEYMLAGGTYRSATDPYATSGTPFTEGPHWIILWPFEPATTGLPTQFQTDGNLDHVGWYALLPSHDQSTPLGQRDPSQAADFVRNRSSRPLGIAPE